MIYYNPPIDAGDSLKTTIGFLLSSSAAEAQLQFGRGRQMNLALDVAKPLPLSIREPHPGA